jgi:hypothetical protein
VALAGLASSLVALALAPVLMPASYSWVAHTTSESAAQGVPWAWLARVGFVLFGGAVVLLAWRTGRWGTGGRRLHGLFGLLLVAAAVFSARPWDPALPFSELEDLAHSVAATAMGVAFAFAVVAVALRRWQRVRDVDVLGVVAVVASVVLPVGMMVAPHGAGLLQRLMFLVAYCWYGAEAIRRR